MASPALHRELARPGPAPRNHHAARAAPGAQFGLAAPVPRLARSACSIARWWPGVQARAYPIAGYAGHRAPGIRIPGAPALAGAVVVQPGHHLRPAAHAELGI